MKRKPKPKRPYIDPAERVNAQLPDDYVERLARLYPPPPPNKQVIIGPSFSPWLLVLLAILALMLLASSAKADCYTLGGVQWNRWVVGEGAQPVKRDGHMMATAGYACQAIEGVEYSLDLGGAAGVLGGSSMFNEPRTTLGAFVGGSWSEAVTIGITPHWVTREPFTSAKSYGLGLTLTTRFGNILDGIGNLFSDSMGEAFKESGL